MYLFDRDWQIGTNEPHARPVLGETAHISRKSQLWFEYLLSSSRSNAAEERLRKVYFVLENILGSPVDGQGMTYSLKSQARCCYSWSGTGKPRVWIYHALDSTSKVRMHVSVTSVLFPVSAVWCRWISSIVTVFSLFCVNFVVYLWMYTSFSSRLVFLGDSRLLGKYILGSLAQICVRRTWIQPILTVAKAYPLGRPCFCVRARLKHRSSSLTRRCWSNSTPLRRMWHASRCPARE